MATVNLYNVGDQVRISGNLADSGGTPVDPTGLTVVVQAPAGTQTAYVYGDDVFPVRVEAGEYYVDVTPDAAGEWVYQFRSTGTGQAMDEGVFLVEQPRIVVQGD